MKSDEYNHVEITNNVEKFKSEYSKFQKIEYSSSSTPKQDGGVSSELNKNETINDDINKNALLKSSATYKESIKKQLAENSGSASASVASSSSAVASGAVASSVAVVAVVTVSTLVGINLYVAGRVNMLRLEVDGPCLFYELELLETKEEDQWYICVEGHEFLEYQELVAGYNEGAFEGLMPREDYEVTVRKEDGDNKYTVLYSAMVRVPEEQEIRVSEFYGAYIYGEADFETNELYVNLSYIDYFNRFDNFALTLNISGIREELTVSLEKTDEQQTVSLNDIVPEYALPLYLEDRSFSYSFSYTDAGETKTLEYQDIQGFYDRYSRQSLFTSGDLSTYADFDTLTLYVTLNYVDDFNYYSDFVFHLTNDEYPEVLIPLEKTTEEQAINIYDGTLIEEGDIHEFTFILEDFPYGYYITYNDRGNEEAYYHGDQGQNDIFFTDIYGRQSQIFDVVVDDYIDVEERTLGITLDFVDGFDYFSNFKMTLQRMLDGSVTGEIVEVMLQETTVRQVVDLGEDIYLTDNSTYKICVTYEDSRFGETTLLEIEKHLSSPISFNSYVFEGTVGMYEGRYYSIIQIDVDDYKNQLGDYYIYFTDLNTGTYKANIKLEKTKEYQYIDITDFVTESNCFEEPNAYDISGELYSNMNGDRYGFEVFASALAYQEDSSRLYDVKLRNETIDSSAPELSLQFYALNMSLCTNYLIEITVIDYSLSDPIKYNFTLDEEILRNMNFASVYVTVDLSTEQDLETMLNYFRDYPVDISLYYQDSSQISQSLLVASYITFSIN